MARFNKIEVLVRMKEIGVIPVFYHPDAEICKKVMKACYDGGLTIFEFTNRGDFAHEVFSSISKYATENLPGIILGVGSIVDPATTALYIQSGADFIVSPALNGEMAKICNRRKVPWIPGCGSVSEISEAEELGADVIKVFPASLVGGPKFVASVLGPMPWSNIMPTGGVEPDKENLSAWFDAGVYCVGMGSKLITKEIIQNSDYELLQRNVIDIIALIKNLRTKI